MEIQLTLPPEVALFYIRISFLTGTPLEQVLHDALFRLAGELSLEALSIQNEDSFPAAEDFPQKTL